MPKFIELCVLHVLSETNLKALVSCKTIFNEFLEFFHQDNQNVNSFILYLMMGISFLSLFTTMYNVEQDQLE